MAHFSSSNQNTIFRAPAHHVTGRILITASIEQITVYLVNIA